MWTRLLTLVNPLSVDHIEMWTVGVNHMAMWTRLLTLLNSLGVGHMVMWTMSVKSHGDVNKIIDSSASGGLKEICPRGNNKVVILYYISLFMIKVYYSC